MQAPDDDSIPEQPPHPLPDPSDGAVRARQSFRGGRTRAMDDAGAEAEAEAEADGAPAPERRMSVLDSSSKPPRNSTGDSFSEERRPKRSRRSLRRSLYRRQRDYLADCWKAFCNSDALHGLGYVVRGHFSAVERGFWAFCILLCIIMSVLYIDMVYRRWDEAPPVLSVPSLAPIWEVPFPAISICPANTEEAHGGDQPRRDIPASREVSLPKWNQSILLTENARPRPTAINLGFEVCYGAPGGMRDVGKCIKTMKEKAPALKDIVLSGFWNGIPLNLNQEVFPTVVSDGGICYTFNMLDTNDIFTKDAGGKPRDGLQWTLENGYPRDFKWESVPRRTLRNSPKNGLYFTMQGKNSYKLVLHAPMDLPIVGSAFHNYEFTSKEEATVQSVRQFELTPMSDEETVISVAPVLTESSELLQAVDVEKRQCYFLNERRLRYFQVYTQRNCEMECLANRTVEVCSCAAIFMPMAKHHRVCENRDCYLQVMKENLNCSCLSSCTTLEYETSVSHYNWKREYTRNNSAVQEVWGNISRIAVKMKGSTFTVIGRTESYSQPEFLADCGGLLGLFSGFSLITLVEAFFHLVVRWWCHTFSKKKKISRRSSVKKTPHE